MHTCFDPSLIYGWCEDTRHTVIEEDWLKKHNIEAYVLDVVKGYAGEFAYGIRCELNHKTGVVTISGEENALVQEAHKKSGSNQELGYFLVLTGDYCAEQHEHHNPEDDAEESDEEEEETAAKKLKTEDK